MRPARGGERGSIPLMIVLGVVVILTGLAAMVHARLLDTARTGLLDGARVRVVQVAASGVDTARVALRTSPGYRGATVLHGGGTARISVRPGHSDHTRVIVVRGSVPGPGGHAVHTRVEAEVALGEGLPRVISWEESP